MKAFFLLFVFVKQTTIFTPMSEKFKWYKSYPSNVPQTIDPNKYENLVKVFDDTVARFGDQVAFQNMDKTLTFND